MAEKDFWAFLRTRLDHEGIPGRARRVEEKSRSGFPDLLVSVSDLGVSDFSVTYFLELKWCNELFSRAVPRRAPFGLEGPQAVELDSWARVGAPAFMLVCFGEVQRTRLWDRTSVGVWWGGDCVRFFRDSALRGEVPSPVLVYEGRFSWREFFRDTRAFGNCVRQGYPWDILTRR